MYASGNTTEHSETLITLQVLWICGDPLCSIDVQPNKDTLQGVMKEIADSASVCACQLQFTGGGDLLRKGLLIRRWIKKIKPPFTTG